MSKQTDAAYLAGFMDGEGTFSIVKTYEHRRHVDGTKVKNIRYHLHVKITNTNKKVLDWIVEHFGGQLAERKRVMTEKRKWELSITSNRAMERFILSIMPYLIVKREQAAVALSFVRLHGQDVPSERARLRQIMLTLNDSRKSRDFNSKPLETNTSSGYMPMIESVLVGDSESERAVTPVGTGKPGSLDYVYADFVGISESSQTK